MRFPYLRSTIVPLAVGCCARVVIVAGLAAGLYGWPLFGAALGIGLATGVPLGLWAVGRMRGTDPLLRPESATMDPTSARRAVNPAQASPYPPAPDQGRG